LHDRADCEYPSLREGCSPRAQDRQRLIAPAEAGVV
jgi:hypothetical protein